MKQLQDSSFSSVEEKSFDENSSQELSLESLSEISGARGFGKDVVLVPGKEMSEDILGGMESWWYKSGGWKKP